MSPLEFYVQGWRESSASILALLPTLSAEDWAAPTDCPGWTVKDVAAHLAHLENELVSGDYSYTDPAASIVAGAYTQIGVDARRDRTPAELISEFADSVAIRSAALTDLPDDPHSRAPVTPGGIDWSWDTLLRNRCVDVWVHEQDIRRAIGRPGGLDSAGAQVTINTFKFAMPYVIGKKVRPAPGTSIGWHVIGGVPFDLSVVVDDDGRAHPVEVTAEDLDLLLSMSSEDFAVLAAGRRTPDRLTVAAAGDAALADSVLAAMPVTF